MSVTAVPRSQFLRTHPGWGEHVSGLSGDFRRPLQLYDLLAQDAGGLICDPLAQVQQVPQDPDDLSPE